MIGAAAARPWAVALAFALAHLAIVLAALIPTLHSGGDGASYLALAQSLRDGGGYRELWDPAMRPHTQYPPGFPLLLAAAMSVGIKPWVGFKVLVAFFSAAAVGFSFLWARRAAGMRAALGVAGILAISPGVVDQGRWELSDAPFWAMTMLALWAFACPAPPPSAEKTGGEPRAPDRRWMAMAALAAAATLAAYMTRAAGLPLVVGAAAWLAWRRRWTALALLTAIVAPFGVWWALRGRALNAPGYAGFLWYVDPYRPALGRVDAAGLLERMWANVSIYASSHLPSLVIGWIDGRRALVLGAALVLLALSGWVMRVRRPGAAEFWLPLYMGLVLIWPREWAGERFLLPALPVLLVCAAEPVRWAAARMRAPWLAGAAAALIMLLSVPTLRLEVVDARRCQAAYSPSFTHPCLSPEYTDYLDIALEVRGRLPAGSAVLARKPTLFWAESGYRSRVFPFSANPDTLIAAARAAGARYVMLDQMDNVSMLYVGPVLIQRPQAFCVMRALGPARATLLAIVPGAERMPNLRSRPGDEQAEVGFRACGPAYWARGRALPPAPPG
ncbi:phospholipid carrier-dependent glycosyltransferase [Longimicrobium sp.]|uniref:phospholipid carrier-dependent glycosyltransferase n=1 Tax=Longimicrobium sp. TaxID=2029185 RepID=UPI002EDB4720